ncbi:MAG TPA: EpsG family protein [Hanamia sp.]
MVATLLVGIISVLFAFLAKYKETKWGLIASFTVIFIFLALRYDFGNDYMGYLEGFNNVNSYGEINYFGKYYNYEIGWLVLIRLFHNYGFFSMVGFLALLNCIIYYRFIKKYVEVKYYWLAVFIYVFDPRFMLIQASAMRQSLAIGIFILSIDYIYKKDLIRFALCIGIASLYHSSALILFPAYFLGFIHKKGNKYSGMLLFGIFISLFLFPASFASYINSVIAAYFQKYEIYQGAAGTIGTGIGVLYASGMFLLVLFYDKFQSGQHALLFKIAIVSFLFIPLSLMIALISRVGMYFTPSIIIVYPRILKSINSTAYKVIFIIPFFLVTGYVFVTFFNSELWRTNYGVYKTIFSVTNLF